MKRIAWFSPLAHPHRHPAAAFTHAILPYLRENSEVELFVSDADLSAGVGDELYDVPVRHYHQAHLRHSKEPFSNFVFNLDNSPSSRHSQVSAQIWPGITLFHDARLNALYRSQFAHSTAAKDLNELMDAEFGEDSVRVGDYHVRGWDSAAFNRIYSFGRSDSQAASLTLVASENARRHFSQLNPNAPIERIAVAVDSKETRDRARDREELKDLFTEESSDCLRIVWLADCDSLLEQSGKIPESFKRANLELSKQGETQATLLCLYSDSIPAESCSESSPGRRILRSTAKDSKEFFSRIRGADIVVCLMGDELQGLPPGLLAAIASGVPSLVFNYGACQELVGTTSLGIEVGPGEEAALIRAIVELCVNKELRAFLSESSISFAQSAFDPKRAVASLNELATRYSKEIARKSERQQQAYAEASRELLEESILVGDEDWKTAVQRAAQEFSWER